MLKFKIEIRIVILAMVIGTAVVTSGYFAYRSLSRIVFSIHREAYPDNTLFLIKNISNDLGLLENHIRLSVLTNDESDLDHCDSVLQQISRRLDYLKTIRSGSSEDSVMIASFREIAQEKQEIWKEILNLHLTNKGIAPRFSQLYSRLEKQKTDTLITAKEKKGFVRKLLGISKTISDTTYLKHEPDKEEIRREISDLEKEFVNNNEDLKAIESQLLAKNMLFEKEMNSLITLAENRKADERFRRTAEVDRLAASAYDRLMAFTVFSVILLLISIFMLFDFLKRSRAFQDALLDARQKAENLALAKEQFVANVSHELRTPVNVIYGLTEQMMQNPLDPQIKELASVISKSSEHLKKIVTDTLEFSKMEAGKIKLESVVFSPFEICKEVVAIHRMEASMKGIGLDLIWNGENRTVVTGDPFRLRQILINLVGNAVKFTEKGKVILKVTMDEKMDDMSGMDIRVEDTGIGISESDLRIIFDEFVQAEHPSGKKYRGTGLGLSIVRRLVEMQDGHIEVKSEPAKGTCVHITLNYRKAGWKDLPKTGAVDLKVLPSFENLSVLIADDDELNIFLVKKILKKWGVKSVEVNNGNDAVAAALTGKFDVILMDLRMPGMDGLNAAKAILQEIPEMVIVAISATVEENAREAAQNAGMRHFISKPFSEKELYDILIQLDFPVHEKPDLPDFPLDTAELRRLADNDDHFLQEMILLFIRSSETAVESFQEYVKTGDHKSISEDAHKIAASCRQMGAMTLYSLVKQLEEAAKQREETQPLLQVIMAVASESEKVNTFLKKYLRELTP